MDLDPIAPDRAYELCKHDPIFLAVICFAASILSGGDPDMRLKMLDSMQHISQEALILTDANRIINEDKS